MTAGTERHPAAPHHGLSREGQKGMAKVGPAMTACTERHPAAPHHGLSREGQKGMAKVGSAMSSRPDIYQDRRPA